MYIYRYIDIYIYIRRIVINDDMKPGIRSDIILMKSKIFMLIDLRIRAPAMIKSILEIFI